MPKKARVLSALEAKRLSHPGTLGVAAFSVGGVDGLQLEIAPTGARSWIIRMMVGGKRRKMGLGGYPDIPLGKARERAREARELVRNGIDPVEDRKVKQAELVSAQQRGLAFSAAMLKLLERKAPEFKSARHAKLWRSSLELYAVPSLGKMLVSEIAREDVLRILEPIWFEKTDTAKRLRQRVEAVLQWSTVAGHRSGENPARWKGNLDAFLPSPSKVAKTSHHPALALTEASAWMADLRRREGIASRALEFVALTAVRSGDVRGATWGEMDLEREIWTIPAHRMKTDREHRVPLSSRTAALLEEIERVKGIEFVFAAARGGMLSDAALSACMKRMHAARDGGYLDTRSKRPAVPHGLRSTFRDWAAEFGYPREMAEIALAHNVGSEVERAYRRSDMLERRRSMMTAWSMHLLGENPATVVAIHG